MSALIIIGVGYSSLSVFALAAFALAGRADDATDQARGDWPSIHPEMRGETTRKGAGGGGCAKAGRLGESHSHIQTSSVSHSGQGAN